MANVHMDELGLHKPIRLWPGVVIVGLLWLIKLVGLVVPEAQVAGLLGALVGALGVVVWWLFFSRAPWIERVGAILLMIVAVVATRPFLHESISKGMMGKMFFVYALPPVMSLALVAWAVASRRLVGATRWVTMAVAILLAGGMWTLLRTEGVTGQGSPQLAWRWAKTHEEMLPARIAVNPAPARPVPVEVKTPAPATKVPAKVIDKPATLPPPTGVSEKQASWPGFRGSQRDGVVRNVTIKTEWASSPPVELWRRPIGPGWSSFAVSGDLIYTQEQRSENEMVACYRLSTGEPVWEHQDAARFWSSEGGAGPRATPAVSNGRVYTLGGTGILNALDASNGSVLWTRNAANETGAKLPGWGFSGSPLVVDNTVIVAVSSMLAAYDAVSGEPRWTHKTRGGGYSSAHPATIGGVRQVILLNSPGAVSIDPSDGKLLWEYAWPGTAIMQPAVIDDRSILMTNGDTMGGQGLRRLAITRESGGWPVKEVWTSAGLKPYFNDFVVHNGHAYGFDGFILSCIELEEGKRKWKGGRYGHGQMLLLQEQNLLFVLSEEGEIALVSATPDKFAEVARFKAIEGKTWNHPVIAGDTLLIRNGQEMAAFRLSLAQRSR